MNKKQILITGANGFIGSTLTDKALEIGHDIWAGVRSHSNLQYIQDTRVHFIELHYGNPQKLAQQLRNQVEQHGPFDAVIHTAGLTKAIHNEDFDKVNYLYTCQLVEALQEAEALSGTFVLLSTLGVMGPGDEKYYTPFCAENTPHPNTAYGKSKLKAEQYLQNQDKTPWLIVRPTGVYGPRDRDYLILMKAVKSGLDVGAGFRKQLLSFIHSHDLATLIFGLLEKGIQNRSYVVSDGDCYTDTAFNTFVQEALGKKKVFRIKVPLWLVKPAAILSGKVASLLGRSTTFNSDKYLIMKQRNWSCNIDPLRKDIGFTPKWKLREGVKMTVDWYHEQGWL